MVRAACLQQNELCISLVRITDGEAVLASASSTGHIALWDLSKDGRLLHVVPGAHFGAVSSLEWVPGQPILISSGEDNSVKVSEPRNAFVICILTLSDSNGSSIPLLLHPACSNSVPAIMLHPISSDIMAKVANSC